MNKLGIIILFLISGYGTVLSQVLLDKELIPSPGDTLYYFTDQLPSQISINAKGENIYWNYSFLQSPFLEFSVVQAASGGTVYNEFSKSDLCIVDGHGLETYYAITEFGLKLLGGWGMLISGIEVSALWKVKGDYFTPGLPLYFDDENQTELQISVTINPKNIPNAISRIDIRNVDSLEIILNIEREEKVDSWGEVLFPGGEEEVLRVNQIDQIQQSTRIKRSDGWVELELTEDHPFHWEKEQRTILFFGNRQLFPVISIETDVNERAKKVTYAATPITLRKREFKEKNSFVIAKPNPAISYTRFSIYDIKPGNYTIKLFNILGKELFDESIKVLGSNTLEVNLDRLSKGTYLYSLMDENGNRLITKRLIIQDL